MKRIITDAVGASNVEYDNVIAMSLTWVNDDTDARNDAYSFERFCASVGIRHLNIRLPDETPAWKLRAFFLNFITPVISFKARALLLMHYSGHGYKDMDGKLMFSATVPPRLAVLPRLLGNVYNASS